MLRFTLTLSFLLLMQTQVKAQTSCPDSRAWRDNVKMNTMTNSTGGCWLSVMPFNVKNLTYRDFLFDEQGLMMVFASFGEGDDSQTTGAREFYLFPRKNKIPTGKFLENNDLVVTHPSGTEFLFSSKTGDVTAMSPGQLKVSSFFDPSEKSGVEILKFEGILLDLGFRMGAPPSSLSSGRATFKDTQNNSCVLRNSELFRITSDGDAYFRYPQDAALGKFLKTRCPDLVVPF
ncbi:MAG: hypothetical protein ACLGGX_12615 [Bdellovibrionia bacterium]